MGSNPFLSAKKALKTLGFQGFSLFELCQTNTFFMQEKAKNNRFFCSRLHKRKKNKTPETLVK